MRTASDGSDLTLAIFVELKHLGVKVPKVRKFKSRVPKQEKAAVKSKSKIFGVHLSEQECVASSDGLLPKFMVDSTLFLLKHSKEVGLFRKAGSIARQRSLRAKLEIGEELEGSDANDVASLLKQWLRELPEPLIPHYLQDLFIRCHQLENVVSRTAAILLTTLLLPPDHLQSLKYLMNFLEKFSADCNENKMGSYNLALMMAPNIFVSATEAADKTSNNLVQLQALTIELLIQNSAKVGEMPSSLSTQNSIFDWKSGDELDSSGDFLDGSPSKSKKKQKGGQGQLHELFSGIKKLVGQNTTPSTNKLTPEKHFNARVLSPRSASKRKAEFDQQAVFFKKLAATSMDNKLNVTPSNIDCNVYGGKSSERHARRKSFGLLRRKERKRQKSCKASLQTQVNVTKSQLKTANANSTFKEPNLQVLSSQHHTESLLSPFQCSFEDFLKSVNVKKSTLDCNLTPKLKKFSESPKPKSISDSRLYEKPTIESPYWLRSEKAPKTSTVISQSNEKITDSIRKGLLIENCVSSLHNTNSMVSLNGNTMKNSLQSEHTNPCSILSDSLYELSPAFRKRSFSTGSKLLRKAAITRQEGFILKSKAKTPGVKSNSQCFNKEESNEESIHSNTKGSVIVLSRKKSRQGSLKRGRPNSVKTGLLSQSLKNKTEAHSSDIIEINTLHTVDNNKLDIFEKYVSSTQCLKSSNDEEKKGCQEEQDQSMITQDLSMITQFDNFSLFSQDSLENSQSWDLSFSGTQPSNSKIERSDRKLRSSSRKSTGSERKQKRKMSLPSSLASPDPGKVRKLRSSDVSIIKTCSPLNSEIHPEICDLDASDYFKRPPPSKDTTFNISNLDCHVDDNCFKTPARNPPGSPNSITWVSGAKFFGLDSPEEDENSNKRESIALILKNKLGNVQEKVSLYDTRVRDSVYCTRRVQNCSTPYIAFNLSDSRRGTSSQNRNPTPRPNRSNAAKRKNAASYKSPIPPPPKFVVSDLDIPSPKANIALKEVTNTSFGLNDDSRDDVSVKMEKSSPVFDERAGQKQRRKPGRSSFPEPTHALVKRVVSRSESSPCRNKLSKTRSSGSPCLR